MKKCFLVCMASAFLFNACTYKNAQGLKKDTYPPVDYNAIAIAGKKIQNPSLEPVEIEKARKMVKHYKDKETKKAAGGYLQFDPVELQELLKQPYVTDVKLVHAAYLGSDGDTKKRNMSTILICVTESACIK